MVTQVSVVIDRGSPVPLYHQLAEQLSRAIASGDLQPGDPFENEVALAERLGLSRPTVRQAIQELVSQGLLLRRRGLGTTVANRRVHRRAELTSLWDDLEATGAAPSTVVIAHEEVTDSAVCSALDLPEDTPLLSLRRLRLAGTQPLALLHNWLPPTLADLSRDDLEAQGLYAVLRGRGVRPVVARQTFGARMPTAAERRLLDMSGSEPLLTMTRTAFDALGRAVEYGDHAYPASRYSVEVMLDER